MPVQVDNDRSSCCQEDETPPDLIVVAEYSDGVVAAQGTERRLHVKRALYGHTTEAFVDAPAHGELSPGSYILAYAPSFAPEPPHERHKYWMRATETNLLAMEALCSVRCASDALSAESVFIGREIALRARSRHAVGVLVLEVESTEVEEARAKVISGEWNVGFDTPEPAARALEDGRVIIEAKAPPEVQALYKENYPDTCHRVVVDEVLSGDGLTAGDIVVVQATDGEFGRGRPAPRTEAMVYFVSEVVRQRAEKVATHCLHTRIGGGARDSVVAALESSASFPIVEGDGKEGEEAARRSVEFLGPTADAITFLGSDNKGAVALGAQALSRRGADAVKELAAAAASELLEFGHGDRTRFRRLRNLVGVLGSIDSPSAGNAVHALIERYLAHVESGSAQPPDIDRETPYWSHEEDQDDVNHALAWLMAAADKAAALEHHGDRLIRLRDSTTGNWRRELQLALDAGEVEDQIALRRAFGRMKGITPVRSRPGARHTHTVGAVAYSHSGALLAMGGTLQDVTIWRTGDWSLVSRISIAGTVDRLAFSPDDSSIYVAGGGGGLQIHARYEVATGKLEKKYEGHKAGIFWMVLSADGRAMTTASFYERRIHLWDTRTGEVKRTWDLGDGCYSLAASPNGRLLARTTGKKGVVVESTLAADGERRPLSFDDEVHDLDFTPDGRHLLIVTRCRHPDGEFGSGFRVALLSIENEYQEARRVEMPGGLRCKVWLSPDGSRMLCGDNHGLVHMVSVPDAKVLATATIHGWRGTGDEIRSVAFTPDGSTVAVTGPSGVLPRILNARSLEETYPYPGHAGGITAVCLPPDGKTIRTYDRYNVTCLWDADTLALLKRGHLPAGMETASIRKPDGRYVLCHDTLATRGRPVGQGEPNAALYDADTGETVARMSLPLGMYRDTVHWLDDHRMLVIANDTAHWVQYPSGRVVKSIGRGYFS